MIKTLIKCQHLMDKVKYESFFSAFVQHLMDKLKNETLFSAFLAFKKLAGYKNQLTY